MPRLPQVFHALGNVDRQKPSDSPSFTTVHGITLDADVLSSIAAKLLPHDLAALGSTCSALASLAACTYPGIKLHLYPHQRVSMAFLLRCEASAKFGSRGGILADEPGTGKTITMISLICKTAGLRTPAPPTLVQLQRTKAEEQWATLALPYKRDLVYKVLKATRARCARGYELLGTGVTRAADALPRYRELVPVPPRGFEALHDDKAIAAFGSRDAFEAAVHAVPSAAIAYWSSAAAANSHPAGPAAAAELADEAIRLRDAIEAALADEQRPLKDSRPPPRASRATLLICPRPLLHHWREQIEWHVAAGCLPGEVLIDTYGTERKSGGGRTKALGELYSAERLAQASLVVTSTERLSMEQRCAAGAPGSSSSSVLIDVHWVRLVVDEGHILGGGAVTNAKVLLDAITAERRWILSGTPAKATSDAEGCSTIDGLLGFLRDLRRKEWRSLERRFLRGVVGAEDEVVAFLAQLMVRHLKSSIQVPQPIRQTVVLQCSASERLAYNSLVSFLRANLVLTSLKGAERGAGSDVSLLHHSNKRSARLAVDNIRLTCNGGGKQVATLSAEYYHEALMWLQERYRAPKHAVERLRAFMDRAQEGEASPCDQCRLPLLLLLVMPLCGHLVCPECVGADESGHLDACPVCAVALPPVRYSKCAQCDDVRCNHVGERINVNAHPLDCFAYLQPGFDLQWAETLREAEARALADSYQRQRHEETKRAAMEGGSSMVAWSTCQPCASSSGSSAVAVSRSGTASTAASATALSHTKADHIINSIAGLRRTEREVNEARAAGRPYPPAYDRRPVRVAIYSESRKTLDALGHFLYLRFGDDAIAQFWGRWRNSELDKFRSGRVRFWRCTKCPVRHELASSKPREVEFPETRCYGRHLHIDIPSEYAPNAMALEAGATSFSVLVNEEDARRPGEPSFIQGTVWTAGMAVETRVRTASGLLGPWVTGRLSRFGKCGGKMPEDHPWSARSVDCFVLLLTRDGSHGLDLSALTHIYLADQVWDPAVEQQVISRAYRMGATGPVTVAQLLMRGTLEETLHGMVTGPATGVEAIACGTPDKATAGSSESPTGGKEAEAPRTPATSAKAAGKRRVHENDEGGMPPAKRARQADEQSIGEAATETPQPPPTQSSSAAAQDEAKVHSLLKSIRFLRH